MHHSSAKRTCRVIQNTPNAFLQGLYPTNECRWLCNGYRRKKWTRLIAFHKAIIRLGMVWIQLFSLQLWVNSRADWFLQLCWGNESKNWPWVISCLSSGVGKYGYYIKKYDGESLVMLELWGKRSTSLLPSLTGPLWSEVIAPERVLSIGQIELIVIYTEWKQMTFAKLNCLK